MWTAGRSGPHHPFLCGGEGTTGATQALGVEPPLSVDVGGAPDSEPEGGVPLGAPAPPLPMFGQFFVDPEPELEPERAPGPELPLLEFAGGVLGEEPDVEPEPEPELPDVVAALATSAPPATRPEVRAPAARTWRKRMCMVVCLPCRCNTGPL